MIGSHGSRRQLGAAAAVSVAYTAHGMIGGWPSPMIPKLEAADSPIPLTSSEGAWVTSIHSLTLVAAVLCVPFAVDVVGRKRLLLFTALPFLGHWLLVAFADSFGMLLAARVVGSVGVGVLMTVCPMYLSEIAEAGIRGAVGTLHQVLLNGGTLLIFCTVPYTSIAVSSSVAMAIVVLFVVVFVWMPDSPYFLLIRGRDDDAVKALLWLRGKTDPEDLAEELDMMRRAIAQKHETRGKFKDLLLQRVHRRTFLFMVGLVFLQLSSGSNVLMSYSTTIFQLSGSSFDANISSIIVGVVQLVMSVVCSTVVDRVGRRPLMIGTFLGCAFTIAIEGTYFLFLEINGEVPSAFDWVPLTALVAYQISFWIGIGTVLFTIMGEVYHVSVKGLTSSVNTVIMGVYGFFLTKIFQVVSDYVGTYVILWIFSALCLVGALYCFVLLPETKGKTFAEINDEMEARMGSGSTHQETAKPKQGAPSECAVVT